jgi:hypothetical protein
VGIGVLRLRSLQSAQAAPLRMTGIWGGWRRTGNNNRKGKSNYKGEGEERVYIPHLRIEMWGTRVFVVGSVEQATATATADPCGMTNKEQATATPPV